MAAGGVDVLRRRDSRFSRKEFDCRENGSRGLNRSSIRRHGLERENDSGSRPYGFYGRTEERRSGGEDSRLEDVVQLPLEKKRKFSPITLEKEEKDVKISSSKRVLRVTPLSPPHRSPSESKGRVLEGVSNGDLSKGPVSEPDNQFQGVELAKVEVEVADELVEPFLPKNSAADLSPELLPKKHENVRETHDQMEEEEAFQPRGILMSRWASDEDSPQHMSEREYSPYVGVSSPESGEIRREGSVGDRATSFSDEEGCYSGSGSRGNHSLGLCDDSLDGDGHCSSEDDGEDIQIEEATVSTHGGGNMLQTCRSVFEYEKLNKINEGTYGVVYKARDKKSGEIVALKKVKMDVNKDDCGFPLSSLREINILSSFSHPSVVNVKEVVMDDDDGIYMVMEYMEYDLKCLMGKMKEPLSMSEVKWLMLQLLEGVKYLHDNWVLHRDLKTSNLLLSKDGELKICDFGLSRQYGSPLKPYTQLVVTLWYRAPEILLGAKEYSTAIDMWSVGCIMAELLAKEPLFKGKTEVEQLDKIFKTLGTPNEKIWPGIANLPGSSAKFVKQPYNLLRKKFPATSFIGSPALTDLGFDLLSKLLTYDPEKRITAEDALNHKWFLEAPLPRSDFRPSLPAVQSQNRYLSSRHREKFLQQL